MTPAIHRLIKKHRVTFGVLVFVTSVVAGMFTILLASSLYFDVTCKKERGPWSGMNDLAFFIMTSPLLLLWSGFTTYCAMKCKPANTMIWVGTTLSLYGYWFYSLLASSNCK